MPVLLVLSGIAALVLLLYGAERLTTRLSSRREHPKSEYTPHPSAWGNSWYRTNDPRPRSRWG
jgi:hypothetical protein